MGEDAARQAHELLSRLWPGDLISEVDGAISVWTLEDKRTRHLDTVDEAVGYAVGKETDVYHGVALRRRGLKPHQRGGKRDCVALTCAYLDLDVEANKFGSRGRIEQLAKSLPVSPSAAVVSGGGLHLYWIFREPIVLAGTGALAEAERVLSGWHHVAGISATGMRLDPVWNVDRILRTPGTFNCKLDQRREVRLVYADGPDCDPSELLEFLPPGWKPSRVAPSNDPVSFRLSLECAMPRSVWIALQNDRAFLAVWERKKSFPSQSEYDLSIASLLLAAGLSDQDVVDAMVFHRSMGGEPPKDRIDYYQRTLATAKRDAENRAYDEEAEEMRREAHAEGRQVEYDDETARRVIEYNLGLRVAAIIRIGESRLDRCHYLVRIELDGKEVEYSMTAAQFGKYDGWRDLALDAKIGRIKARPKAEPWNRCCEAMEALVTTDEASNEASESSRLKSLLEDYGRDAAVKLDDASGPTRAEVYSDNMPFVEDGKLHVNKNGLTRYLALARERGIEGAVLVALLRRLGATTRSVVASPGRGQKSVGRSYWVIPEDAVSFGFRLLRGGAGQEVGSAEDE